jgi:hypothetical protein
MCSPKVMQMRCLASYFDPAAFSVWFSSDMPCPGTFIEVHCHAGGEAPIWKRDLHPDRVVGVMVGGMAVLHAMVQGDERRNGKNPKTASNL